MKGLTSDSDVLSDEEAMLDVAIYNGNERQVQRLLASKASAQGKVRKLLHPLFGSMS